MANTYTQLYVQCVFAVQNRLSLIGPDWRDELYKYITGIVHNHQHKLIAINGTANHVHVFIGYKPHQLIPDLLQNIKKSSADWINLRRLSRGRFQWQAGYGAFSYAHSQIETVVKYILHQEEHHRIRSFREEYLDFLKQCAVPYDERYILEDIS